MARMIFLSQAERARLEAFPVSIPRDELAAYFALSRRDLTAVAQQRGQANRLGFAVAIGALRLLGFIPKRLSNAPSEVVQFVAAQLAVSPNLTSYPAATQTRSMHVQRVSAHLGFSKASREDLRLLQQALVGFCRAGSRKGRAVVDAKP